MSDNKLRIPINVSLTEKDSFNAKFGETRKISTSNYNDLFNKPTINDITVEGEKSGADYNLQDKMTAITEQMIDDMIYGG